MAQDLKINWDVKDEDGVGHGAHQVGDTCGQYRPVDEESDRDDGLCVATFPEDESEEQDKGQGQRGKDQGVCPRHHVSSRVEPKQQDHQEGHGEESSYKVDTREIRLARRLGRHFDQEKDEKPRHDDDGHLDQKCQPPAPRRGVVDDAAKDTPQHRAGAKANVANALDDASFTERDQIRRQEGRDGHEPAAANPSNHAAEDHDRVALGEATDEVAGGEEDIAEDQAGPAAENVRQPARDGLAGGVGDQIGGGEPGEQAERLELARDGGRKGRDDGGVDGAEEDAYVGGTENEPDPRGGGLGRQDGLLLVLLLASRC